MQELKKIGENRKYYPRKSALRVEFRTTEGNRLVNSLRKVHYKQHCHLLFVLVLHMTSANVNKYWESQHHRRAQFGRDLKRPPGPAIHGKSKPRWDYLAPCPIASWKSQVMGVLPDPWGGCSQERLFILKKFIFHMKTKSFPVQWYLLPFVLSLWLPVKSEPLYIHTYKQTRAIHKQILRPYANLYLIIRKTIPRAEGVQWNLNYRNSE